MKVGDYVMTPRGPGRIVDYCQGEVLGHRPRAGDESRYFIIQTELGERFTMAVSLCTPLVEEVVGW